MGDLGQRHPEVRVQPQDQGDGFWTWLHAGRAKCIGGLQSVAALDAPATTRAVADLDVEVAHEGAHHPEVFVVLSGHAGRHHCAATVRKRGRHRRPVSFVNLRRALTAPPPTVTGRPREDPDVRPHTVASLTSRVLADPSGCWPRRPSTLDLRTGTPVPSSPRYIVDAAPGAGSTLSRSSAATSRPSASAVRARPVWGRPPRRPAPPSTRSLRRR